MRIGAEDKALGPSLAHVLATDAKLTRLIRVSSARHGIMSGATYLARYSRLMHIFHSRIALLPKFSAGTEELLRRLERSIAEELRAQFRSMTGRRSPDKPARFVELGLDGYPLFKIDPRTTGECYELPPGALIVKLDALSAVELLPLRFYTYVIDAPGCCFLYKRPLQLTELISGAYHSGMPIKHPMLLRNSYEVRCAGELCLVKDRGGNLVGLLANRSSGHFRPDVSAVRSLAALAMSLGIKDDCVIVI